MKESTVPTVHLELLKITASLLVFKLGDDIFTVKNYEQKEYLLNKPELLAFLEANKGHWISPKFNQYFYRWKTIQGKLTLEIGRLTATIEKEGGKTIGRVTRGKLVEYKRSNNVTRLKAMLKNYMLTHQ